MKRKITITIDQNGQMYLEAPNVNQHETILVLDLMHAQLLRGLTGQPASDVQLAREEDVPGGSKRVET